MGKKLGYFTKMYKCVINMRKKFNIIHKENFNWSQIYRYSLEWLKFKSLLTPNVGQDSEQLVLLHADDNVNNAPSFKKRKFGCLLWRYISVSEILP